MSESHSRPAPAWTLAALVVIGLWIDQHVPGWGQHAVDVVVWAALLFWMARSSRDTRTMLMVCVGWATAGEVFLSLVWGLYDYRLPGIPLFVPPAHALVLLLGPWLIEVYRLPRGLLLFIGVTNLLYASYSFTLALRGKRPRLLL